MKKYDKYLLRETLIEHIGIFINQMLSDKNRDDKISGKRKREIFESCIDRAFDEYEHIISRRSSNAS